MQRTGQSTAADRAVHWVSIEWKQKQMSQKLVFKHYVAAPDWCAGLETVVSCPGDAQLTAALHRWTGDANPDIETWKLRLSWTNKNCFDFLRGSQIFFFPNWLNFFAFQWTLSKTFSPPPPSHPTFPILIKTRATWLGAISQIELMEEPSNIHPILYGTILLSFIIHKF